MNKFELTEESQDIGGVVVYRIRALKDFDGAEKGELGGWVESEDNLSQEGGCWLYDDSVASGNSRVSGDVMMLNHSSISGNAIVRGDCALIDYTKLTRNCVVEGGVSVKGNSLIGGSIKVSGATIISGESTLLAGFSLTTKVEGLSETIGVRDF